MTRPTAPTPRAAAPALQVAASKAAPVPAPVKAARPARFSAADIKADKISMSSGIYRVPANARFVEVHVRRSAATAANASFVWWTQGATATAGTDFVAQGRAAVNFAPGKLTATLYVKLIPDAVRQRAAAFNVVIGEAGGGATLGAVTKSSIMLAHR